MTVDENEEWARELVEAVDPLEDGFADKTISETEITKESETGKWFVVKCLVPREVLAQLGTEEYLSHFRQFLEDRGDGTYQYSMYVVDNPVTRAAVEMLQEDTGHQQRVAVEQHAALLRTLDSFWS